MVVVLAEVRRPVVVGTLVGPTGISALSDRLVESRVKVLVAFAERFAELVDPSNGPSDVRGDGGSVGLGRHEPRCLLNEGAGVVRDPLRQRRPHCTCAYRSVAEFERLVGRLRVERRDLWWHLDGWWLSAETRTVFHCPRCGVTHRPEHVHPSRKRAGKSVAVRCKRVVVWRRRQGARESLALGALRVVAGWWGLEGEPMLPDEYRQVA